MDHVFNLAADMDGMGFIQVQRLGVRDPRTRTLDFTAKTTTRVVWSRNHFLAHCSKAQPIKHPRIRGAHPYAWGRQRRRREILPSRPNTSHKCALKLRGRERETTTSYVPLGSGTTWEEGKARIQ